MFHTSKSPRPTLEAVRRQVSAADLGLLTFQLDPVIRTARPPIQEKLVDEFFNEQNQRRPSLRDDADAFQFGDLHNELDAIHHQHMHAPQPHTGEWAAEFYNARADDSRIWELGPDEEAALDEAFIKSQQTVGPPPDAWREEFMQAPAPGPNQFAPEFEEAFQKHFDWAQEFALSQDKGKGRAVKLTDANSTWDEQFAAFETKSAGAETDEEIAKKIEAAAAAEDSKYLEQFESIWQNMRDNLNDIDDFSIDPNTWENEFADFAGKRTAEAFKPDLGEYIFEPKNPYLQHLRPFEEGLRIVEEGGSLSEAALAFEAVVQNDPENSEAWMHLGNVQAQNEKEDPAIRALERSVRVNAGNLNALMALAVSYTNESYDHAAYLTLEKWVLAKYPELASDHPPLPTTSPVETHERVTELFLAAARAAPEGMQMDPDVQVGLGVLFYGSDEFDKAVDCFVAALEGRPRDYLLWNRLGATLANSGRSEDAIDSYHKALELKPTFVRARYNLGVSCINIGCYKEAAEHLLSALSMHKLRGIAGEEDEGVNVSQNLWDTLRKAFDAMKRPDLLERAVNGADVNQFRDEFEF
ncbi:hypothetical protein BC938DRAFT_479535 [Jimgerdemannia flammicorona]|uniref:Uncharacterized protein n=1 Tax=Jimgerdemannia flammicorona TaxID=994334 RepID=A0A433QKP6_9FUNG|nr:hypothetical protein BC938DRAFT_479535 [Jimgerdemannia flammicorona]